ncbi:MAG: hypothetical protein ABH811_01800 [archaeon]
MPKYTSYVVKTVFDSINNLMVKRDRLSKIAQNLDGNTITQNNQIYGVKFNKISKAESYLRQINPLKWGKSNIYFISNKTFKNSF